MTIQKVIRVSPLGSLSHLAQMHTPAPTRRTNAQIAMRTMRPGARPRLSISRAIEARFGMSLNVASRRTSILVVGPWLAVREEVGRALVEEV